MTKQTRVYLLCTIIVFLSLNVMVEGAVRNCQKTITGDKTRCEICASGFIPTLDRKQCVTTIVNCDFAVNADPKKCATCTSTYVLTYSGTACGAFIANCKYLNDANPTLCY